MKTAVVDLDGTLVRCNSFSRFTVFLFRHLPKYRLMIAWQVALRKLRIISHLTAKNRILSAARHLTPQQLEQFIDDMLGQVNSGVQAAIADCGQTVLNTAAPAIYAVRLGHRLGFDIVLASTPTCENRGQQKVTALHQIGIELSAHTTVITDHHDDLPLLQANSDGTNLIVNPTAHTLAELDGAQIRYTVI